MQTLRLVDPNGYTVPNAIRYCVPDAQVEQVTQNLLNDIAPQHAEHWPDYHAADYRVAPD